MSASRDQSQKTTFVYSNLYQLYRKGKEAAKNANIDGLTTQVEPEAQPEIQAEARTEAQKSYFQLPGTLPSEKNVLKSVDLKAQAAPAVSSYTPPALLAKRIVDKPKALEQASPAQSVAIQSLKDNLKTLNDLHARLKFMLEELQDLVKE